MKRVMLMIGVLGLLGFSLLLSPVWIARYQIHRATPPKDVRTLGEFRARMDDGTYEYFQYGAMSRRHVEARKLLPFYFTFRSGWACYLFDDSGTLVDWTPDNGDDADYDSKWGQLWRHRVEYERAEQWLFEKSGRKRTELE